MADDDSDKPKHQVVADIPTGVPAQATDMADAAASHEPLANVLSLTGFAPGLQMHTSLPADHPFYALVGRIAAEWAQLEHILDLTIWELFGGDKQSIACLTSQMMGVGPRCNAINLLGTTRNLSDKLLKPFRQLRGDAYPVADKRARIVHDPWYLEVITNQPAQFRAMPMSDPRYGLTEIDQSFIEKTMSEIKRLQDRALAARQRILDAYSASQ